MARRIKRFFVFLLFSLFFSLLSGRITATKQEKSDTKLAGENKKVTVWSLNSACAECDPYDKCCEAED